jgi:hypothetical protein
LFNIWRGREATARCDFSVIVMPEPSHRTYEGTLKISWGVRERNARRPAPGARRPTPGGPDPEPASGPVGFPNPDEALAFCDNELGAPRPGHDDATPQPMDPSAGRAC